MAWCLTEGGIVSVKPLGYLGFCMTGGYSPTESWRRSEAQKGGRALEAARTAVGWGKVGKPAHAFSSSPSVLRNTPYTGLIITKFVVF
jgi:hypothetical protein